MMNIIASAVSVGVAFCLIFFIILVASEVHYRSVRNRVLRAIKALNIEDELACCKFGVTPKIFNAINTYLIEHYAFNLFTYCDHFALVMMIAELRKKGKIKKLYTVANHD